MSLDKLYNLTCEGRQFISINPPKAVPDAYYSLVEISYDTYTINTIKGIYVGKKETEISECIISGLDINEVIIPNIKDGYTNKLKSYVETLEEEDKINIIKGVDIIDFNTEDDDEILNKIFLIGLGSILTYYHFMSENQESIGRPFYPLQFDFPLATIDNSVLDQNLAEYLSYPAQILINISTKNHGKLWMEQFMDFWSVWGVLFPKELDFNDSTNDIIYNSVVGYANHLYNQTSSMCKYFQSAENVISDGCDHIQKATEESLNIIKDTQLNFKQKFRYASLLITTISTTVLKTIKLECDYSLNEMKNFKEKCMNGIKTHNDNIEECCNKALNVIEKISTDAREDISKYLSTSVKNIENKCKQVDHTLEEVQKHLEIYTTQCIEHMSNEKHEVYKHLWLCVPEIVEKVSQDVGKIINRNVSRSIEYKFSDVMVDYRECVENRLAEVLNPVVIQKVELFREEADRAIDRVKNHANRVEDSVVKINKMETRVNNLENGDNIQCQLNDLKTDMVEMKDMISRISSVLKLRH